MYFIGVSSLKIGMIKKLSLGQLLVAKLTLQEHQLVVSQKVSFHLVFEDVF
jgi:hypothetical protein